MERLKNMGLKKSFLLLSLSCLAAAFLLLGAVIFLCRGIENHYPLGGVEILSDGSVVPLPSPTVSQQRILATLNIVQTVSCILFPVGGLIVSVFLFYYEEYILSRIMEIIAAEPGFDHIVSSHPCNTLVFPGLELRLKERTVHRNGELISMTHREFATLVYLANHPSWVFSAGQIYEEVWGEDGENCGTAVASVIGQIRRKLTPDMPKAGYIRTVLGSGYKFEVPQGMAE